MMNNTSIMLATGQILNVGDTFYYCSPEYRDGTIESFSCDSFWPGDTQYGLRIRCTSEGRSEWLFVWQNFFERNNPTCFVRYADAKARAEEQLYHVRR